MRHTKREVAQALLAQAPPGWRDERTEKAAARKSGPRGKQPETTWLHKIIKPFTSYLRLAWIPGMVWLARNNVGRFIRRGVYFNYGLGTGTSDAVGLTVVLITPEMVGQRIAQFTVFEAKSDHGKVSAAQEGFLLSMRRAGARVILGSPDNPPTI